MYQPNRFLTGLLAMGIVAVIAFCCHIYDGIKERSFLKQIEAEEKRKAAYEDSMKDPVFAAREIARLNEEAARSNRLQEEADSIAAIKEKARHKERYGWRYEAKEDRMTSDSTYSARVISLNELAPPPVWEEGSTTSKTKTTTTYKRKLFSNKRYPVTNNTTTTSTSPSRQVTHYASVYLQIRKNTNGTTDVMVNTSGGSFANIYNGVRIRFDKNKPVWYSTTGSSDGGNQTLFIHPAASFIKKLKKSNRLLVEAAVAGRNTQIFEFETDELQWNR